MVQEVYFRPGEAVAAGQPVLALLPPDNRKLRFYVPEPLYTSVPLGSAVTVTCDGCGRDGLPAQITFASREVEFTPPVIFSQKERARLVFRLEARLEGEAARLPLGLPVTVRLRDATPVAEATPR
jgi:HlyD family secretion protein